MPPAVSEPMAYLNGEFLPFVEARLPVFDLGIMQGATVTERMRTVGHRPYLVAEHLDRLRESLAATGMSMPLDAGPMEEVIDQVARRNLQGLPAESDLAIVLFVTAGQSPGDGNGLVRQSRPTVCVYTAPLPWTVWHHWFEQGVSLSIPEIRQIPAHCISPQIKHRSRFHWSLADQSVKKKDPFAQALLLDADGFVTETSSGNLFVVRDGRLITPRRETTLPGIAQAHVTGLARQAGWSVERENLTAEQVAQAEEAFLTSSTYCMVPVSRLDGRRIGSAFPGPMTTLLADAWSAELGFSLRGQVMVNGVAEPC